MSESLPEPKTPRKVNRPVAGAVVKEQQASKELSEGLKNRPRHVDFKRVNSEKQHNKSEYFVGLTFDAKRKDVSLGQIVTLPIYTRHVYQDEIMGIPQAIRNLGSIVYLSEEDLDNAYKELFNRGLYFRGRDASPSCFKTDCFTEEEINKKSWGPGEHPLGEFCYILPVDYLNANHNQGERGWRKPGDHLKTVIERDPKVFENLRYASMNPWVKPKELPKGNSLVAEIDPRAKDIIDVL